MAKKEIINPGWSHYETLTFSPAVKKGNLIFVAGMGGTEYDPAQSKVVVRGDIVEQIRLAYQKVKTVLEAAGATMEDVVKTTEYITTDENYRATAPVRREFFQDGFPAATGVIVKSLLHPGMLIEVDVIAMVG